MIARRAEPSVRAVTACLALALFLAVFDNLALWRALRAASTRANLWPVATALGVTVAGGFSLFFLLVGFRYTLKPVAVAVLMIAAAASYALHGLGIPIDVEFVRNMMQTDVREAREFVTPSLAAYLVLLGVLPSAAFCRLRIEYGPLRREIASRGAVIAIGAVVVGVAVGLTYKSAAYTMRQNRRLRMLVNPSYPIYALAKYAWRESHPRRPVAPVGLDAVLAAPAPPARRRRALLLVVGETARAAEFALGGYGRPTTPNLAAVDVVNFTRVRSCGTSTAVSLPCMFFPFGPREYSPDRAAEFENLLDVVQRAGVDVRWRDNNSGCKGVCARVPSEDLASSRDPRWCVSGECFDEILLDGLPAILDRSARDALVILHQKGSHGPAYYKRVPPAFVRFTPTCTRDDVSTCTREEIVNAYDNTILYTDFVLSKLIALLEAKAPSIDVALLYVSDHGESLGEKGIYLHGFPEAIAPDEQTRVPMLFWASGSFYSSDHVDRACLRRAASEQSFSHHNLFHTVLGIFGVRTSVYDIRLDFLAPCRGDAHSPARPLTDTALLGRMP